MPYPSYFPDYSPAQPPQSYAPPQAPAYPPYPAPPQAQDMLMVGM